LNKTKYAIEEMPQIAQPITQMTARYAVHPQDFEQYTTTQIRHHFLVENLFTDNDIVCVYTHHDRLIIGGVKPVDRPVMLPTYDDLKSEFFLQRRELGIINVGNTAQVEADGKTYTLKNKEALFIGKDTRKIVFYPSAEGTALFYFNSAPAHVAYPSRKISLEDADVMELGSLETSNHRIVRKLIVNSVVPTCQLQMGLTELKTGSVWNTMPPHTHSRRMEAYFYFNLPPGQMVCHFMGEPQETRHLWVKNHQAIISPPWSIHSGAGTSSYAFIWGMAGENLDYGDMDKVDPTNLK
jgi:4-deoxy-L-threo-5-hexosulose-uronate ketol-isomerase